MWEFEHLRVRNRLLEAGGSDEDWARAQVIANQLNGGAPGSSYWEVLNGCVLLRDEGVPSDLWESRLRSRYLVEADMGARSEKEVGDSGGAAARIGSTLAAGAPEGEESAQYFWARVAESLGVLELVWQRIT